MSSLYFDQQGRFVMEDYNEQKPFASFLPGIAGIHGIPLWVYYVNRGQGIASFGVENKNGCIMEFMPAEKSYQAVAYNGFRTFIKVTENGKTEIIEPFSLLKDKNGITERMLIKANEVSFEYINTEKALSVTVTYFTLPGENFAALAREVTLKNLSDQPRTLEVLDGLPRIMPYGIPFGLYQELSHTIRSWMQVYNLENDLPFYKCRASIADSSEVSEITAGHFYLSFTSDAQGTVLKPIVDSDLIFGTNTSNAIPVGFIENALGDLLKKEQVVVNKTPCGFSGVQRTLEPKAELKLMTLIGNVSDISIIQKEITRLTSNSYFAGKRTEANKLIEDLTKTVETKTASPLFDGYIKQSFLDNLMRGGYPIELENNKKPFVYHVFSRKHGDLERDYNFFSLAPEFYSQGNGNFRDANQNRRNDVILKPFVGDFNVKMFMNLIQTDGYNPLVVKGCTFTLSSQGINEVIKLFEPADQEMVKAFFKKPYTPGKLFKLILDKNMKLKVSNDDLLKRALQYSVQNIEADFGEGYWSDHWSYNMDLIDSYLSIYPENKLSMLFDDKTYRYYDTFTYVLPRSDKFVHVNGKVRQYHANIEDEAKEAVMNKRSSDKTWVRTKNGLGEVYETTLFEKLLSLSLIKYTSMDPLGMGVEMEGDKPGWNDSLNGLPGMFGSGMSETFETKRIFEFLLELEGQEDRTVSIPEELYTLLNETKALLEAYNQSQNPDKDYAYWDSVETAREAYREKTRYGLSGELKTIALKDTLPVLKSFLNKMNEGIEKAKALGQGLIPTYFTFEAIEWEPLKNADGSAKTSRKGQENVKVLKFKPHCVSYFLEGPTKSLKLTSNTSDAKLLYNKVKESELFDRKLKMYKTCVPLKNESMELGRGRAFTPGWLENESVFTHMEYKYVLEVLKSGLHEEFFEDIKTVLVPFQNPEVYGRSTLENSSFIASSANPDPSVHGKGFVSRLTGATAELLSMWTTMMAGRKPFILKDGKVVLSLSPNLPGWFFTEDGKVSFKFLGATDVTYINSARKNTYGADKAVIARIVVAFKNGETQEFSGNIIPAPYAISIRNGEALTITGYLE